MKHQLPLPYNKKLHVTFRVESGCLGPDGENHVEAFCHFAEKAVVTMDADFIFWHITPRHDKTLPELEYSVNKKKLDHDKADKYLNVFDKCLDEFEDHLEHKLSVLMQEYWEQ